MLVRTAVDWPSLFQWVCSLTHWSCQRCDTCRQKSWLHAREQSYFLIMWLSAIIGWFTGPDQQEPVFDGLWLIDSSALIGG